MSNVKTILVKTFEFYTLSFTNVFVGSTDESNQWKRRLIYILPVELDIDLETNYLLHHRKIT
eukprot:UN05165